MDLILLKNIEKKDNQKKAIKLLTMKIYSNGKYKSYKMNWLKKESKFKIKIS